MDSKYEIKISQCSKNVCLFVCLFVTQHVSTRLNTCARTQKKLPPCVRKKSFNKKFRFWIRLRFGIKLSTTTTFLSFEQTLWNKKEELNCDIIFNQFLKKFNKILSSWSNTDSNYLNVSILINIKTSWTSGKKKRSWKDSIKKVTFHWDWAWSLLLLS